jgi:nucleotide-binding universal stress UspA family protein
VANLQHLVRLVRVLRWLVRDAQGTLTVIESLLIAVDGAPFADRVAGWLPDLVSAGVRRATLFHAIEGVGEECVKELDTLRPRLDRLAVQLTARDVEADIALKRGDRVRWLTSLAELRTCQALVLGAHCSVAPAQGMIGSTLRLLLEESRIPLLIIHAAIDPTAPRLFERAYLLSGNRHHAALEARARALLPATLHSTTLGAGEVIPPGASLLVTGPEPSGDAFERLIAQSSCPVLVFPAPSLSLHPEKGPSIVTPPSEASGAARRG